MKCGECKGDIVDIDGEWSCNLCGLVTGNVMDFSLFENDELSKHKDGTSSRLGSHIGQEKFERYQNQNYLPHLSEGLH